MPYSDGKAYVIGSDANGHALKTELKAFLDSEGVPYEDVGVCSCDEDTMYPVIAERVAKAVRDSGYTKNGILVCGTGIGMSIAANKFRGIYAAVCHDIYSAERARLSNNTNVITMGAQIIGPALAVRILAKWLSLEFVPGRSTPKIQRIREIEESEMVRRPEKPTRSA